MVGIGYLFDLVLHMYVCPLAPEHMSADPAKETWLCRIGRCCLDDMPGSHGQRFVHISGIADLLR